MKMMGCVVRGEEEDGAGRAQVKGVGGPAVLDIGSSVTMCRAGGGGDDNTQAEDGRGLCIIDVGCLIDDAEDGNVETATGWVPYEARDVAYARGRLEDGIILSGGMTMRTEVLKVPAVNGGWTVLLNKGQDTGGGENDSMKTKEKGRKGGGGGGEKDDEAGEPEAGGVDGTGGTWRVDLLVLMLWMVRVPLGADY